MKFGSVRKSFFLIVSVFMTVVALAPWKISATAQAQASHGTLQYDTSKCSTDPRGMVYFAVGKRVYRQPMENLFYITAYSPENEAKAHLPQPPKSSEPSGCPGRPIQAMGYNLSRFSDMPDDKVKPLSAYADRVSVEVINNPDVGVSHDELYDQICAKFTLRDTSTPGFTGCQKPFKCDGAAAYQAQDYYVPNGRKLTLWCNVGVSCDDRPSNCDVAYKLYGDLNLWYKFKTTTMPLAELVNYDRELRRRLDVAEVKNYPWANSPPFDTGEKQP